MFIVLASDSIHSTLIFQRKLLDLDTTSLSIFEVNLQFKYRPPRFKVNGRLLQMVQFTKKQSVNLLQNCKMLLYQGLAASVGKLPYYVYYQGHFL
jgi:hypothetical protein